MSSHEGERWPAQVIAEAIPDAIALVNLDDRVVAWNLAMASLVEIPPSVALGNVFAALDISHRVPQLRRALEDAKRTLQRVALPSLSFSRRDGLPLTVTVTLSPTRDEHRVAILIHCSTPPLPASVGPSPDALALEAENQRLLGGNEELLALNEELRGARDHLETELARVLATHGDAVVTGRAVSALLAFLRGRTLASEAVDRAFTLLEQTPRLEPRVLAELTDLGALARRELQLERVGVLLEGVAVEAIDRVMDAANTAGVRMDFTTTQGVMVRADRRRLEQVASTLVSNAVRFTPDGGRVDVAVSREGDRARFRVADSGCGLSAEILPTVFEPFCRGNGRPAAAHRGLGLRLALARGLIELHGGVIQVESPGDGRGTTMTVILPAA